MTPTAIWRSAGVYVVEWTDARSAASYLARAAHALRVAGRGRSEE